MGKDIDSGAKWSEDGLYRYLLWRIWEAEKDVVGFILLNPSTADVDNDSPTSDKLEKYAKDWGYGGYMLGNLFAFKSTDRKMLEIVGEDAIGPSNDHWLKYLIKYADRVVCAWGEKGKLYGRANKVLKLIEEPYCLCRNQSGQPAHTLYLQRDWEPKKLNMEVHLL